MKIQCDHLNDNYCLISTNLANLPVVTCEAACIACSGLTKARTVNTVTIGQAISQRIKLGMPVEDLKTQLIKIINKGPGTELKKLIPLLFKFKGCNCKNYATKMDRWGIEGCLVKFDLIVEHLVNQSKKSMALRLFPTVLAKQVAAALVSKAIENAKRNTK